MDYMDQARDSLGSVTLSTISFGTWTIEKGKISNVIAIIFWKFYGYWAA